MPTIANRNNHGKSQNPKNGDVIPRPLDDRLSRIEDLLIEVRHEQDVLLKRMAKAQSQIDALTGKPPSVAHLTDLFKLRQ